jgi:maleylpyruvate isomerase
VNKPKQYLAWMDDGYKYFSAQLAKLEDGQLDSPSALPGWTRKHLLAHVGFNARALGRLVHWAKTGEITPMYPNTTARADEIEEGSHWTARRLHELFPTEQEALNLALDSLTESNWHAEVVTGQRRTVPAMEIPWLRARELWIHATDLAIDADFGDFPPDLIDKLVFEVVARRRAGEITTLEVSATDRDPEHFAATTSTNFISGKANDLARWLTGRGTRDVRPSSRLELPILGPWL